jgi:GntR family transcriptional regulator
VDAAAVEPSKARRIYLLLGERIASGALTPGARLPGEPALAAEHGVSRMTARRALDRLACEGLVQRRPGAGTFVRGADDGRGSVVRVTADLADVFAHLKAMGRAIGVRLVSFAYGAPPDAVAAALGLAPGERAQRSVRVRSIDGAPFSWLTTHVPERIGVTYTEVDLAATPLLELLERSGVVAARASQAVGATLAGPEAAEALRVEIGAPLLSLTRVVYDAAGSGVEHLHALYRPDGFSFQMDLLRTTGALGNRCWSPLPPQPPAARPRTLPPRQQRRASP